ARPTRRGACRGAADARGQGGGGTPGPAGLGGTVTPFPPLGGGRLGAPGGPPTPPRLLGGPARSASWLHPRPLPPDAPRVPPFSPPLRFRRTRWRAGWAIRCGNLLKVQLDNPGVIVAVAGLEVLDDARAQLTGQFAPALAGVAAGLLAEHAEVGPAA